MSEFPEAPATVPSRPTTVVELYDRLVADANARELRLIARDKLIWEKLATHDGELLQQGVRITRIERNAFPQLPLWMLVLVGLLLFGESLYALQHAHVLTPDSHAAAPALSHDPAR